MLVLDKNSKLFIWFLFILSIILTLEPFFKIGFTTADDLENYMSYLKGAVYAESWIYAKGAGRFYFIITKPLYSLPYVGDSFVFTKILQHASLILSYFLFAVLSFKIFKSKAFSYLIFLLLLLATPVSANYHIPFIAYPFYFTISFSMVIGSVLLFIKYTESYKYKFVIISAILFFIAVLFYETYLIFLIFLCFYILFRNLKLSGGFVKTIKSKDFYREAIPFVLVGVLYVLIYFVFRILVESPSGGYSGSSFAKDFSFANFFILLGKLTKAVFPGQIFSYSEVFLTYNSGNINGHQNQLLFILSNLKASQWVNIIIQCVLLVFFYIKLKNNISYKKVFVGIIIAILFAYSAHIILGLSEKYNTNEYSTIKGYVTSYYSYFGVWCAFLLASYSLIKLSFNTKWLRISLISVFAILVGITSAITSYTNDILSSDWGKSQLRFEIMDEIIRKDAFSFVEETSIVYSPDMYESAYLGTVLSAQTFNWGDYIYLKTNTKYLFAKNPESLIEAINKYPNSKIYYFTKRDIPKTTDILLTISEINKESIDLGKNKDMFMYATSNRSQIHYYSTSKTFNFRFDVVDDTACKEIIFNETEVFSLNKGLNQLNIANITEAQMLSSFILESCAEIYVESYLVSNMLPKYSRTVNIADGSNILFNYGFASDSILLIGSEVEYPMALMPVMDIEKSYSGISLAANIEVEMPSSDKNIQIVVEIRDTNNEIIFWESEQYSNLALINYSRIIDAKALRKQNASKIKFFMWNPQGLDFTIKRINNISVKAI